MLLQKRSNGYYYFRWVVPFYQRKFFPKTEFIRSLGTKNHLQARVSANNLSIEILKIKKLIDKMDEIEFSEYKDLCKIAWDRLNAVDDKKFSNANDIYLIEQLEAASDYIDVLRDNYSPVEKKFTLPLKSCVSELDAAGLSLSSIPESFHEQFANDLIKMRYRLLSEKIAALTLILKGEILPSDLVVDGILSDEKGFTFDAIFNEFLNYKISQSLAEKEQKYYKSMAEIISCALGGVPFSDIKRKDLIRLLGDLAYLPLGNVSPYNKMTACEKVVAAKERAVPKNNIVSAKTVLEYKKLLQGVFKYAVDFEIIEESPAKNLTFESQAVEVDRDAFSRLQLRRLLTGLLELDLSKPRFYSYKWISLIAIFSGARLGEVTGLRGGDIKFDEDSKIWYFLHSAESGATKNLNAKRLTPVHDFLIKQGILEVFDGAGDEKVFKDVRDGKAVTIWFPRFRDSCGIDSLSINGGTLTFHSLRHSFITIARENGAIPHVIQQIVGHESKGYGVTDTYTGNASLATKKTAVDCFKVELD